MPAHTSASWGPSSAMRPARAATASGRPAPMAGASCRAARQLGDAEPLSAPPGDMIWVIDRIHPRLAAEIVQEVALGVDQALQRREELAALIHPPDLRQVVPRRRAARPRRPRP